MHLINESSNRICLFFGNKEEYDTFIKYIKETTDVLPFNFIINDFSSLNEVDPNFDSDQSIKFRHRRIFK
jgi:hypothetical protein